MINKKSEKQEFSAGGVVYKKILDDRSQILVKYLLGKHSGYHKWVLPKGMIEPGETAEETAMREVKEEMGVTAKMVKPEPLSYESYVYMADFKENPDLRRVKTYQESGGEKTKVSKKVTWFLMEWVAGNPEDHDWEMEEAGWFSYEEAREKLSFEGERLALTKAHDTISQ